MIKRILSSSLVLPLTFTGLAAFKLWLSRAQALYAMGGASHDDHLFVTLAQWLSQGHWLGPYNNLTLAKGPFYPMFVAGSFRAGVPLLMAENLLYIVGCSLLILAIKPLARPRIALLPIYVFLLFNPVTTSIGMLRVIRQGIYHSLALIIFACVIGMLSYHNRRICIMLCWAVGAGIALSCFWLCREEGLTIMPSVILLLTYIVLVVFRLGPSAILRCVICALPVVILYSSLAAISRINYSYYGVYCTVEFARKEFVDALAALQSVKHKSWRQYVLVPKEARERVYQVSPSFAELKPFLEGSRGKHFDKTGTEVLKLGARTLDIPGTWFIWALRDAVIAAGYTEPGEIMKYYARLGREIRAAFRNGKLERGAAGFLAAPPWRMEYWPLFTDHLVKGVKRLVTFGGVRVTNLPSIGSDEKLLLFSFMTNERLTTAHRRSEKHDSQIGDFGLRINILGWVAKLYQSTMSWLVLVCLMVYLLLVIKAIVDRKIPQLLLIATCVLGALLAQIVMLVFLHISSFHTLAVVYWSQAYLLLLLFCVFSLLGVRGPERMVRAGGCAT